MESSIVTKEILSTIKAKVAELKKNDSSLKKVYPIYIVGDASDTKPYFIGYFRQPTFVSFSKYLTFMTKDQVAAMRQLAKDCFIAGDKELVDDDSLFLFGLMSQFSQVIEVRNGELVNL